MSWLVIEDEGLKLLKILEFIRDTFPGIKIREACSVRAGIKALGEDPPTLLILDMSLPTFDISPEEPGGRPQTSGGAEILRHMDKLKLSCPTIVVTGHEAFITDSDQGVDLEEIDKSLKASHHNYRGLVYYSSVHEAWEKQLESLIKTSVQGV